MSGISQSMSEGDNGTHFESTDSSNSFIPERKDMMINAEYSDIDNIAMNDIGENSTVAEYVTSSDTNYETSGSNCGEKEDKNMEITEKVIVTENKDAMFLITDAVSLNEDEFLTMDTVHSTGSSQSDAFGMEFTKGSLPDMTNINFGMKTASMEIGAAYTNQFSESTTHEGVIDTSAVNVNAQVLNTDVDSLDVLLEDIESIIQESNVLNTDTEFSKVNHVENDAIINADELKADMVNNAVSEKVSSAEMERDDNAESSNVSSSEVDRNISAENESSCGLETDNVNNINEGSGNISSLEASDANRDIDSRDIIDKDEAVNKDSTDKTDNANTDAIHNDEANKEDTGYKNDNVNMDVAKKDDAHLDDRGKSDDPANEANKDGNQDKNVAAETNDVTSDAGNGHAGGDLCDSDVVNKATDVKIDSANNGDSMNYSQKGDDVKTNTADKISDDVKADILRVEAINKDKDFVNDTGGNDVEQDAERSDIEKIPEENNVGEGAEGSNVENDAEGSHADKDAEGNDAEGNNVERDAESNYTEKETEDKDAEGNEVEKDVEGNDTEKDAEVSNVERNAEGNYVEEDAEINDVEEDAEGDDVEQHVDNKADVSHNINLTSQKKERIKWTPEMNNYLQKCDRETKDELWEMGIDPVGNYGPLLLEKWLKGYPKIRTDVMNLKAKLYSLSEVGKLSKKRFSSRKEPIGSSLWVNRKAPSRYKGFKKQKLVWTKEMLESLLECDKYATAEMERLLACGEKVAHTTLLHERWLELNPDIKLTRMNVYMRLYEWKKEQAPKPEEPKPKPEQKKEVEEILKETTSVAERRPKRAAVKATSYDERYLKHNAVEWPSYNRNHIYSKSELEYIKTCAIETLKEMMVLEQKGILVAFSSTLFKKWQRKYPDAKTTKDAVFKHYQKFNKSKIKRELFSNIDGTVQEPEGTFEERDLVILTNTFTPAMYDDLWRCGELARAAIKRKKKKVPTATLR